jgi:hypothetical protein
LGNLIRIPPAGNRHRSATALTLQTFWARARRFYRIDDNLGPLFAHVA